MYFNIIVLSALRITQNCLKTNQFVELRNWIPVVKAVFCRVLSLYMHITG